MEFKFEDGFMMAMFYPIFFFRRLAYVLVQVYFNDMPGLQIFLNIGFAIMQLSYCLTFRPFVEKSMFVSEVSGEVCTLIIFCSTSFFVFNHSELEVNAIENIAIYSLTLTFIVQMAVCLYGFVSSMIELVKKIKKKEFRKKRVENIQVASE